MKKSVMKILSALLIGFSLVCTKASANEYTGWRTNTIVYSNPTIAYTDSSQWTYINSSTNGYWMCLESQDNPYTNTWIYTNGKWYYVNDTGMMEFGVLVGDKNSKNTYSLDESGAMETNTYYQYGNYSCYIDNNGLVDLPQIYYDAVDYYRN